MRNLFSMLTKRDQAGLIERGLVMLTVFVIVALAAYTLYGLYQAAAVEMSNPLIEALK